MSLSRPLWAAFLLEKIMYSQLKFPKPKPSAPAPITTHSIGLDIRPVVIAVGTGVIVGAIVMILKYCNAI